VEVYYCEKCSGRPYTKKLNTGSNCPVCNTLLRCEDVTEESLENRPTLSKKGFSFSAPSDLLKFIRNKDEKKADTGRCLFNILDNEKYVLYLGVRKTGKQSFSLVFLLGNDPDENGIVGKTPFISTPLTFDERIEITTLETAREIAEKYIYSKGWRKDTSVYHAFLKNTPGVVDKAYIDISTNADNELKNTLAERYYIYYSRTGYGGINIKNPFKKSDINIFDEVKKVHDLNNNNFMRNLFFRSKNGEIMEEVNSFADASAILFDDPYTNLLRYDKIMKEVAMERF